MPEEPRDFDEWVEMVEPYMEGLMAWENIWFSGECMEGRRGGRGRRGGKMDDDEGDSFIDWSEDKDRIIMTGVDGSKMYIEMGATSVAASALTAALAAYTLF